MSKLGSLDELAGLGGAAAKSSDELLALARASARSADEFAALADAIRVAKNVDASVINAAKTGFKVNPGSAWAKAAGLGDNALGGAKGAAKGADDALGGAKGAAKGADDALGGAKGGAKGADDVAKVAGDADGVLAWAKKNPGKALAGAGASAAALYAANSYMQNNGKKVGITKIEAASEGGVLGVGATNIAKITFTPDMEAIKSDTLKIEGTDCVPPIDGASVAIFKIYSSTVIGVKVEKKLTTPGTKGSLTLTTSVAGRAGAAVGGAAGAAGSAAGTAAGAAAGGLGSGLGLDMENAKMWIGIILLCLFVGFIIFKFIL
jgi:hypothetical protein